MRCTTKLLEAGEAGTDEAEQSMLQSWPGYGQKLPAGAPVPSSGDIHDYPPDTSMDHTWQHVDLSRGAREEQPAPGDDIPDLLSVAGTSDDEEDECSPNDAVSINYETRPHNNTYM